VNFLNLNNRIERIKIGGNQMKYWVTWEDLKGRQGEQEFETREDAQRFARLMRLQRLFAVNVSEEIGLIPCTRERRSRNAPMA
jgi:hypothetical protein